MRPTLLHNKLNSWRLKSPTSTRKAAVIAIALLLVQCPTNAHRLQRSRRKSFPRFTSRVFPKTLLLWDWSVNSRLQQRRQRRRLSAGPIFKSRLIAQRNLLRRSSKLRSCVAPSGSATPFSRLDAVSTLVPSCSQPRLSVTS